MLCALLLGLRGHGLCGCPCALPHCFVPSLTMLADTVRWALTPTGSPDCTAEIWALSSWALSWRRVPADTDLMPRGHALTFHRPEHALTFHKPEHAFTFHRPEHACNAPTSNPPALVRIERMGPRAVQTPLALTLWIPEQRHLAAQQCDLQRLLLPQLVRKSSAVPKVLQRRDSSVQPRAHEYGTMTVLWPFLRVKQSFGARRGTDCLCVLCAWEVGRKGEGGGVRKGMK